MNATPRIRRPRRPEGAPALAQYVSAQDIERATGLPLSTCYEVMDEVAKRAGLDLSQRSTRAKLLPLAAWNEHSPAVLSPVATEAPRAPAQRRPQTPPRATLRASAAPTSTAPAVPLTTPRKRPTVAA